MFIWHKIFEKDSNFSQQLACRRHKISVNYEKAVKIVMVKLLQLPINRLKGFEPVVDVYCFKI